VEPQSIVNDGAMADSSFTDVPRQLKVFVGGLSQNSSRESLNAYFGQYDPFVDCYIMKDGRTGRSRGFAFANFADESAMEMLLQLEHNIDGVPVTLSPYNQGKSKGGYKGRPLMQQARPPVVQVVGPANNQNQSVQSVLGVVNNLLSQQPGGAEVAGALNNAVNAILQQPPTGQPVPVMQQQMEQRPQGEFKIFVGGLSQETTKESLSAYFSQYGQADAYVMKDGATGRSRGFAFVNFAYTANAANAKAKAEGADFTEFAWAATAAVSSSDRIPDRRRRPESPHHWRLLALSDGLYLHMHGHSL